VQSGRILSHLVLNVLGDKQDAMLLLLVSRHAHAVPRHRPLAPASLLHIQPQLLPSYLHTKLATKDPGTHIYNALMHSQAKSTK